jgi:hypothetical protein
MMAALDALSPAFRALVHDFGAQIVSRMIGDGYENAAELRGVLETWRERRQEEWLRTDYIALRPHELERAA